MADTPIIDAAIRVARALRVGGCVDLDIIITAALRTALPYEPSAEKIDAMAEGSWLETRHPKHNHLLGEYPPDHSTWGEVPEDDKVLFRDMARWAYRAQPIWRELYPEYEL